MTSLKTNECRHQSSRQSSVRGRYLVHPDPNRVPNPVKSPAIAMASGVKVNEYGDVPKDPGIKFSSRTPADSKPRKYDKVHDLSSPALAINTPSTIPLIPVVLPDKYMNADELAPMMSPPRTPD